MQYGKPRIASIRPRLAPLDKAGGGYKGVYQTAAHQAWRKAVLKRDGYACVKCGAQGEGVKLYADHIRELHDGGAATDVANGQTLCAPCHARKTKQAKTRRSQR